MNNMLLSAILPLVVGPLTFALMQGLKSVSVTVDALPPVAKRIAVMGIAIALTAIGTVTQVDFNCDPEAATNCLSTLDKGAVKAAVSTALAFVLHYAKQKTK